MSKRSQPGLGDRHREGNGEIERKHGDTMVGTLRQIYGDTFAAGSRPGTKSQPASNSTPPTIRITSLSMGQEGFTNTIRADNGTVYELPPAEYNLVANCTRDQALEKAKRAAQKTLKKFAVIVSEYTGCSWVGLTQIQQRARA